MIEETEFVPVEELARPQQGSLSPEAWNVLREQALVLVRSGFLPHAVNTPEKAISIVMKGRELGVPPMYALSNIAVINGKPTAGAELMLALIYRDHGDEAVRIVESTPERCTIAYRRKSWQEPELFSFSIEDADCAGLLGKDNWRHYPAAMLRARCISAVARLAFPDTIGGLYTPEELGARVRIAEEGDSYAVEAEAVETVESPPGPQPPEANGSRPPATAQQRDAIRKLSRLLGEPVEAGDLDASTASQLLAELSRRYNALDPAERRRLSREPNTRGPRIVGGDRPLRAGQL